MADTLPGGTTVFSCPLSKCGWTQAEICGGIIGMAATEQAIRDHLSTHDLVEWVTEVVNLHDTMAAVATELDENGRIGRTLLTGSYPTAANVARNECIRRIGRAIKGEPDD